MTSSSSSTNSRCLRVWRALLSVFVAATSVAVPISGQVCTVPGDRATLVDAVADVSCAEIVLASSTFVEGSVLIDRDLSLRGTASGSTTVAGQLKVVGSTTQAAISKLTVDAAAPSVAGCFGPALDVGEGAQVSAVDVVARNGSGLGPFCTLFADGFESGGTSNWDSSVP